MSEESKRAEMAMKTIVLTAPGMDEVTVRRGMPYAEGLVMDMYEPPGAHELRPCVVLVFGFPHPMMAQGMKDMGGTSSWARLLAASGMTAVAGTYRDPAVDFPALLARLRQEAGIDPARIGLWAASGNVPTALGLLMREEVACAALLYGYMFGASTAAAAAQFGFVDGCAGKTVADLAADVPVLVVRAGKDQTPGLNETLDAFVGDALSRNLPVEVVNVPAAPHAFDLFEDSEASREAIRRVVAFLRYNLGSQRSTRAQ
jgi:acetyl esterase/lipase